jgi:hypothetical protein
MPKHVSFSLPCLRSGSMPENSHDRTTAVIDTTTRAPKRSLIENDTARGRRSLRLEEFMCFRYDSSVTGPPHRAAARAAASSSAVARHLLIEVTISFAPSGHSQTRTRCRIKDTSISSRRSLATTAITPAANAFCAEPSNSEVVSPIILAVGSVEKIS